MGDTQHHNPKELNEQILAYLRKEDPNLIINGRVAGAIYGDYLSTPDRPLEFGPMTKPEEQDWEAIPTTNESYGYHSLDKSHKSPTHFIRLLAKAAAKGGNLLLNIGPMGKRKDGSGGSGDSTHHREVVERERGIDPRNDTDSVDATELGRYHPQGEESLSPCI